MPIIKRMLCLICLVLTLHAPLSFAFSPYSNQELDQLEKEFVEQINQSPQVIRDPLAQQYIHRLAKRLAEAGQLPTPDFFIVNSNEINAFAGPGGHIGVNTQLILASDNESELSAVMAHEMAHVRLHHLYRMLEHQKQMKIPMLASLLASIALGVVNPALGSGAVMASMAGFAQNDINFIRSNEKEADNIGIDVLHKSGLDPRGMANFFKKMQENSRYYSSADVPAILRTHPIDEDRIAEAENRTAQMQVHAVPPSLDYALFKELIRTTVSTQDKLLLDQYIGCIKADPQNQPCHFGHALALYNINQFANAESELKTLEMSDTHNLYYSIALSRAENNNHHATEAINRLKKLETIYPDNQALLIALSESYLAANLSLEATATLLKANRFFPRNLKICEALARTYASNHRKDYAYFTQAQCEILQGRLREAKRLLKLSQQLIKKDPLLQARVEAKIDEISDSKD